MIKEFPNGLTVKELKELVKDWPEVDEFGDPCEVWLETGVGISNVVKEVSSLNLKTFDDGVNHSADLILSSNA